MGEITTEVMISINSGPEVPGTIVVEQEWIDVSSSRATKPDPGWEFRDKAGHFHAYDVDGKLPTLQARTRHVDCDGEHVSPEFDTEGCEGYDVVEHFCLICNELVKPGRLNDSGPRSMPGRKSWTVTVHAEVPRDAQVSIRAVDALGGVFFGIAYRTGNNSVERDGDGATRVTSQLYGRGQLGTREPCQELAAA